MLIFEFILIIQLLFPWEILLELIFHLIPLELIFHENAYEQAI